MGRINTDDIADYCEGDQMLCCFCPWASGMDYEDEVVIKDEDGLSTTCDGCCEFLLESRDLVDAFSPQPRRAFRNLN